MARSKVPSGCAVGMAAWGYTQLLSVGTVFSPKELKGKTVEVAIVPLDGRFKITRAPKRARRKTNGNR